MSRATEIAEREALAAEAEHPDEEGEPEPQPDEEEEAAEEETPAPEPEPSTEAELKAMSKALDAEDKRHGKAVAKALGSHFEDFRECPLCQVAGYVSQYQVGEIDPEQRAEIMGVMGEGDVPPIVHDPNFKRCPNCNGHGKRETGSLMEAYYYETCGKCQTTGRVSVNEQPTNVAQFPTPESQNAWTPPPPPTGVNVDTWGRPMGHPDWGLDPASVVSVRA